MARSFASRGSWEVSAGLFSNSATSGLSLDCDTDGDGTTCDVTLPPVNNGQQYILETFTRPTLSAEALAARFLEQSTFGTTRESMNDLVDRHGLDYENWIIEQMDMPISSMREYYRKRTNPKYEFPYALGAVGSGPCDIYSRWRTYAVSIEYFVCISFILCHTYEFEHRYSNFCCLLSFTSLLLYNWHICTQYIYRFPPVICSSRVILPIST